MIGYIDVLIANQRAEPSHRAELVNQVLYGHQVEIKDEKANWLYCKSPHPYEGWIEKKEVFLPDNHDNDSSSLLYYKQVLGNIGQSTIKATMGICLRYKGEPQTTISNKSTSPFDAQSFYLASDHRGKEYVVSKNDWQIIDFNNPYGTATVIHFAKSMLDAPYLWGGCSALAPDCSGLVWLAHFLSGISLPRDAHQQATHGTLVENTGENGELLQPGDLIFFAESGKKISHVGISLGGSDYIHASGKVLCNSLSALSPMFDSHRRSTWAMSRRLIKSTQSNADF